MRAATVASGCHGDKTAACYPEVDTRIGAMVMPQPRRPILSILFILSAVTLQSLGGRPATVRAEPQPLADFIEIVRGYDVATIRRTFPAYNQGLFRMIFGAGDPIPLTSDAQKLLFEEQLVTTPAGTVLDIGHVITGIEAATALTPVGRLVEQQTGCSMLAAVTWSGDVGKALHDSLAEPDRGNAEFFFSHEASDEDLYGDIDGHVLGYLTGGTAGDVAQMLADVYIPDGAGLTLDAERFQVFLHALGAGGAGTLTATGKAMIAREITCFAGALATFGRTGVTRDAIAAAAPYFVDRFIQFIEDGLARELEAVAP
jgi:hypothetical protein